MGLPAKQRLRSIGTGLTGSPIPVRTPFSAAQLHADFRQVRQYLFHGVFGFFVGERAVRRAQNQTVRQTLFARSHMLAGVYVEQRQAFQRFSGLAIAGSVGEQTWNAIFDRLAGIAETGPLPQDVAQEIAEEVGYLVQAEVIPNFPGQILRLGDSDT